MLHADTRAAAKRAKRIGALAVPAAVTAAIGLAVGFAAPAAADTASYLQSVQPRYAYLSESQLLSAGNQVCTAARSGVPASDNVIRVSKSLGISPSASWELVIASINHLGC